MRRRRRCGGLAGTVEGGGFAFAAVGEDGVLGVGPVSDKKSVGAVGLGEAERVRAAVANASSRQLGKSS